MPNNFFNSRIKLRHIVCYLEVARLKSFVKAASSLGVTQPAVSKTIQELEAVLEVPLFDRSRRSLVLTRFGEVFLRYASASVAALRQGIDSMSDLGNSAFTVRIAVLPSVSEAILPAAVNAFVNEGLPAKLQIVTGPNDYLLSLLRLGGADFIVGRMAEPSAMTGFAFEHLYSEKVVFAVRPEHPLLTRPFVFSSIADYKLIVPPPGSIIRPSVEKLFLANGITALNDELQTVSGVFGRTLVRSSDYVWVISEGVVSEGVAAGNLDLLPVDTSETLGPVGITTRNDAAPTLPVEVMKAALRSAAASANTLDV